MDHESAPRKITVHDMTLRDGMHPKRHSDDAADDRPSLPASTRRASADRSHTWDGLGGSSVNHGFPAHTDEEYLSTVIPLMRQAKVFGLLCQHRHRRSPENGKRTWASRRSASPPTAPRPTFPSSTSAWRASWAWTPSAFLMMAHMNSAAKGWSRQAKLMEGYGANCIYITDSAGICCPKA